MVAFLYRKDAAVISLMGKDDKLLANLQRLNTSLENKRKKKKKMAWINE